MTRSSNDISDIVTGVDIKLLNSGITTIKISQDTKSLTDEVNSFITNYNNLIDNLNATTIYDTSTKKAGMFQGVSQIRDIKSDINNTIFSFTANGKFLSDFGITQNSAGHLQLDDSKFQSILNSDPSSVKDFFEGGTTNNPSDGIFVKLNNNLQSIFMDTNSEIKLYKSYLDTNLQSLNNQKDVQTQRLDDKYNILATKFAAFDTIIANFNQASQSLQMQINSYINNKK
jgi:flagellar hook-associated protein 2